jgi:hypothetical protein
MIVVLAVAGCGGASHPRRDAVNRYFDRVDAAQRELARERGPISEAFRKFSAARNSPAELQELQRARTMIDAARKRVLAIHPPVEARQLHADLIRVFTLQLSVAVELVEMSRFVPRYAKALAPLRPASVALSTDLRATKAWKPIAVAFERYRASLESVLARLDKLSAPRTLRPGLNAQRAALRRSVALCVSIGAALVVRDSTAVSAGIRELSNLGASNAAKIARQEQLAAARAYNARLGQISTLALKIGKKRDSLVKALG